MRNLTGDITTTTRSFLCICFLRPFCIQYWRSFHTNQTIQINLLSMFCYWWRSGTISKAFTVFHIIRFERKFHMHTDTHLCQLFKRFIFQIFSLISCQFFCCFCYFRKEIIKLVWQFYCWQFVCQSIDQVKHYQQKCLPKECYLKMIK